MIYKELIAKYKGYNIVEMGYPGCIPFTCLPKELQGLYGKELIKAINNCEVKGYCVSHKEFTNIDITHRIFRW